METMNNQNKREKRMVSFFIWDPELERKINCEVKMIDGISKLLNVATTLEQTIECHKALVLSQQRMLAFMSEIQRKQKNLLKRDNFDIEPTKATVILSDIRLPLVWTSMKAKSEQKKFAVFCLARIGCEIIDTQLISIDKHSTEIMFTDQLLFSNVPHDFQLDLEIYALNKSLALSSSIKDFANRYSYYSTYGSCSALDKTSKNHKSSNHHEQKSKFVLIARTTFTKESVHKLAKVRNLKLEPPQENSLMQLPLHSSFIGRFIILPLCYTRLATFAGIIEVYNVRYSCMLTSGFLNGEEIMRNDYSDQHRFSIPITADTIITSYEDRFAFSIYNRGFDQEEFFVQDLFTLNNWIRALQQHIVDIRAWQTIFEHIPSTRRYSYHSSTVTSTSAIIGKTITDKRTLTTKARSLDDLHQLNISSQSLLRNRIDQTKDKKHIIDHSNGIENNDDDDVSEYHTRL